jgi:HEAT repeat protein
MKRKFTGVNALRFRVVFVVFCIWLAFGSPAAFSQTPQEKPWEILQAGLSEHKTGKRAAAIESTEKALGDKKPAVRAAAATALGQMGAQSSVPLLKQALADKQNQVFFAAADSLLSMGDPAGYDVYYEILTGERKSGQGLIAAKKKLLTDPSAMVLIGIGIGISYAPYAGYGWMVWRELSKDYATPVRVNALRKLANDPDSRIGEALVKAASDKHWTVRAAALSAIARHGDPSLISSITPHMRDKKAPVRYTAAAAVLRLSALVSENGEAQMATQP